MDDIGLRKLIAEKAETGNLHSVAPVPPRISFDFQDLHFKEVAWLRAFDVHRTGERVHAPQVSFGDIVNG